MTNHPPIPEEDTLRERLMAAIRQDDYMLARQRATEMGRAMPVEPPLPDSTIAPAASSTMSTTLQFEFRQRCFYKLRTEKELCKARPEWLQVIIESETRINNGLPPLWLVQAHDCWLLQDEWERFHRHRTEAIFWRRVIKARLWTKSRPPGGVYQLPSMMDDYYRRVGFPKIQRPPLKLNQNDREWFIPQIGIYVKSYDNTEKACPVLEHYLSTFNGKDPSPAVRLGDQDVSPQTRYRYRAFNNATVDMIDKLDRDEGELFMFMFLQKQIWWESIPIDFEDEDGSIYLAQEDDDALDEIINPYEPRDDDIGW